MYAAATAACPYQDPRVTLPVEIRSPFKFENEPADNLTEMTGLGVTGAQEAMAQEKRGSDEQHERVLDSVATLARISVEAQSSYRTFPRHADTQVCH
jgi:hypothetical protein